MDDATHHHVTTVSFRFEQDPTGELFCSNTVMGTRRREQEADGMPTNEPADLLDTLQNSNPRTRRDRMTRRKGI